ncbi:MAG: O-antigen ligase family protein [Rhodospirillaceae bacterium]|jgi:exopolysaccharide production protein ExoQ|nr:O-antigen ligase family protein [Rhodospirillales bacterium]MBT4702443.1 O-antigen ligase family protein [Rhodospirillaceae bacterium]MBT5034837.1 O-antigen ligase family protein [Rhodospirillaceae bacterium]MBT6361589.1 O-antigen ligase family protein [Rhodospirillaceae bacterium]MBT7484814.1 O-antigen ligase family protein [Rhodospirillales bacterium]
MKNIHKGHILGFAAFFIIPLAIFMPKSLAPLFVVTSLLILGFHVSKQRVFPKLPPKQLVLFLVASIWALTSSIWSIAPDETLSLILPLSATFFAGLVISSVASNFSATETETFSKFLVVGFFIGIIILTIEIITPLLLTQYLHSVILGKGFDTTIRARGFGAENFYKNGVTIAALLFWPCLAILWNRFGRFAALALTLVLTFIFFISGSLSAFVALVTGVVAALGFLVFKGKAINIYIIAVVLATFAAPLIPQALPDTRELSKIAPRFPDSVFPRIVIWKYAASIIAEDPISGKGLDTARVVSRNTKVIKFFGQNGGGRVTPGIPLHPHNTILQIWVELGLVGAIIFGLIMITILRQVGRLKCDVSISTSVIGMFFTTFFVANVSYGIWQSWWQSAIWLNVAFIVLLAKANNSQGDRIVSS